MVNYLNLKLRVAHCFQVKSHTDIVKLLYLSITTLIQYHLKIY